MNSILEAKGVSFAYVPGKWALHDLNFTLTTPRRVCLLGANGVGKSTLMMLLNGTLRPQRGELVVLGQPIDYSPGGLHRLHREVGVVLQDPDDQLFGATVEQDVAFGPLNNGLTSNEARVLVHETLKGLGITHLADRPIHDLSLGEKKRVALAGVLVSRPQIILLDEPTAGLDFAGVSAMLALLNNLHEMGTTLLVSTHDTDLAYGWGDEAWILRDGRIAAQGPKAEILRDPQTLQQAHLKIPALVDFGLAIQKVYPTLPNLPLPGTREEFVRRIEQIRHDLAPADHAQSVADAPLAK